MIPENNSDKQSTPESDAEGRAFQEQIVELQTKLAFQEDTVSALNEIVSEQQQDILAIKSQVNLLLEELKSVLINLESGASAGIATTNEKPPHY